MNRIKYLTAAIVCLMLSCAYARVTIPMYLFTKAGDKKIGDVTATDTQFGLLITPELSDLPPGTHGFHIHAKSSCSNAGMDAGGHLDPKHVKSHKGPFNDGGHLGDLPVLEADDNGFAEQPILAPRLKETDLRGHALIIHAGGDNYSDQPEKLGGGGARIACGVTPPLNIVKPTVMP